MGIHLNVENGAALQSCSKLITEPQIQHAPQNSESWGFPAVQWLRLQAASTRGAGLIPDQGTKIPHAV